MRWKLAEYMKHTPPPLPEFVVSLGLYFLLESTIRLRVAAVQAQPMGSILGYAWYSVRYLAARDKRKLADPLPRYESARTRRSRAPLGVEIADRYKVTEAFLALLSPDEQRSLQQLFG